MSIANLHSCTSAVGTGVPGESPRLSRAQFLYKLRDIFILGSLAALPGLDCGAAAAEALREAPLSAEETEYWRQKQAELDADTEVQRLRLTAQQTPRIKTKKIYVGAGILPDNGNLSGGCLALTFDDGPTPANTRLILRALQESQIGATFFHIGLRAEKHPELSRLVLQQGHTLGSHTMHHPDLSQLPVEIAHKEILDGCHSLTTIAGSASPFFRFPYGSHTDDLLQFVKQNKLAAIAWNMSASDWKFDEDYYNRDLRKLFHGIIAEIDRVGSGVLLMHDKMSTALVLPDVLNYIKVKQLTVAQFIADV